MDDMKLRLVTLVLVWVSAFGRGDGPPSAVEFRNAGGSTVERTADPSAVQVNLSNGTELCFALEGEWMLGLREAVVNGVALSAGDTVQRPILAADFSEEGEVGQSYRLLGAKVEGDRVVLDLEIHITRDPDLLGQVFVMRGSRERLLEEGMTPELTALQSAAEEAGNSLRDLALAHATDRLTEAHREFLKAEEERRALPKEALDTYREVLAVRKVTRWKRRMRTAQQSVLEDLAPTRSEIAEGWEGIAAWEKARDAAARNFPVILRDNYMFPFWRQPNEVNTLEHVRGVARHAERAGRPAGTLRWILSPHEESVGGWRWQGWSQHFELDLKEVEVNHLAVLGTWEVGGRIAGNTVYALRYRGLGGLVQDFSDNGDGGAAEAWSTTNVIPGSARDASRVLPPVEGEGVSGDRTDALRHRVGASIAQPARGAGSPFFDFQIGDWALLVSVPARQGNLRAVSEVMPGDRHLSQTDLQYFATGSVHTSIPMRYLVLTPGEGAPFSMAELRTRYQEMDQHVRKVVSEELGFVQYDVLPGVHYMIDHNFGGQMGTITRQMDQLAEQGVRRIESHQPGWQNGRERNPGQPHIGGGSNDMYDYWPLAQVEENWKKATAAAASHGIPHYVWFTGMCRMGGPLYNRIGSGVERWAFNAPDPTSIFRDSTGYGGNANFNIHNAVTRERLLGRLREARETFGFQGFWADSFQNLFMSQLDWSQGTGDSLQRTWWELIAEWSREGVSWTSESHAFPGQSCSIEVQQKWGPYTFFLANQVNRAFRAHTFPHSGTEQADEVAFGFMANRGWAAVDLRAGQMPNATVPSFKRLADEYAGALPLMRRSYQLSNERGVLWLGYGNDAAGVWFSPGTSKVPSGVEARPILGETEIIQTKALHTYQVKAEDLIERFALRRGPLPDERIGTVWQAPAYYWPEWAKVAARSAFGGR